MAARPKPAKPEPHRPPPQRHPPAKPLREERDEKSTPPIRPQIVEPKPWPKPTGGGKGRG